jgi:Putative esterase
MKNVSAAFAVALLSAVWLPAANAQTPCVTQNMAVPPGANTRDKSAPFFIDTTGLDFKTAPPTRDPSNPNYPHATELADGTLPPLAADGNFIIGPTHMPAPETVAKDGVPHGTMTSFILSSRDSVIYSPGRFRDDPAGCNNGSIMVAMTAPGDKSDMVVTTSHPGSWTRTIAVYVPAQYVRSTEAPFIVIGDGGSTAYKDLIATLDNLIAARRLPPLIAIQIGNGGQDAQGSQRGREYDDVSGTYTEFVEREVLPLVERRAGVTLTKNPEGRATMGLSSSGAAAFTMAWFYPDLYRRVLAFSPTMVNQQWPHDPALRGGAWEYHSPWAGAAGSDRTGAPLIPSAATKPIRFWFMVGDQDLFYPNPVMADGMHDWTLSNELMAKVLAAKGYHYQFVFVRNAKHVDRPTIAQILPEALEWLWKGYPVP